MYALPTKKKEAESATKLATGTPLPLLFLLGHFRTCIALPTFFLPGSAIKSTTGSTSTADVFPVGYSVILLYFSPGQFHSSVIWHGRSGLLGVLP